MSLLPCGCSEDSVKVFGHYSLCSVSVKELLEIVDSPVTSQVVGSLRCLTHGTFFPLADGYRFSSVAFSCHPKAGPGDLSTRIPGTNSEKACLWVFKS